MVVLVLSSFILEVKASSINSKPLGLYSLTKNLSSTPNADFLSYNAPSPTLRGSSSRRNKGSFGLITETVVPLFEKEVIYYCIFLIIITNFINNILKNQNNRM